MKLLQRISRRKWLFITAILFTAAVVSFKASPGKPPTSIKALELSQSVLQSANPNQFTVGNVEQNIADNTLAVSVLYEKYWNSEYLEQLKRHLQTQLKNEFKDAQITIEFHPSLSLLASLQTQRLTSNAKAIFGIWLVAMAILLVIGVSLKFSRRLRALSRKSLTDFNELRAQIELLKNLNEELRQELDGACHLWQSSVDDLQSARNRNKQLLLENQSLREKVRSSLKKVDQIETDLFTQVLSGNLKDQDFEA